MKEVSRLDALRQRTSRFLLNPITDVGVIVLILISVGLLVAEYSFDLTPLEFEVVDGLGLAITIIFAIELSLRFWVAKKKSRFFRRYWPDIIAVLPMFRPLRFLRILRLLRLFRLGLLLSRRVSLFRGVFRVNMYEVWVLAVVMLILVVGSATMAYFFEARTSPAFATYQQSFWWAVHSLIAAEPVGAMPQTVGGQLLLVGVMLSGMTMFAVFTGVVSATVIDRLRGRQEVFELDVDELEGHILVCGWNAGVPALVSELAGDPHLRGASIVLINELESSPDLARHVARPELLYHIRGDHTKLDTLRRANAERASKAVVMADAVRDVESTDRDARTVLAALTLERLNPTLFCTVELMDRANETHLRIAGVEAIVMRNDLSGRALATACRHPKLITVLMELLTLEVGETIYRMSAPKEASPYGDVLASMKTKENVLVLAVEHQDGTYAVNPARELMIQPTDQLIVVGPRDKAGRA